MSDYFNISTCNIAQAVGETNRFLFHVFLLHIASCIVNKEKCGEYLSEELFKTLTITVIAICLYHLFIRKLIEPKINKMKLICYDKPKRINKKKKLSRYNMYVSKLRRITNDDNHFNAQST